MLSQLTLIFSCQLVGELAVRATGAPAPGPVIGMVLLFAIIAIRGGVPPNMGKVADGLLSHLSLLFVPAGVGVMVHAGALGADWGPLAAALVGSTVVAIAVTALVMRALAATEGAPAPEDGE